MMLAKSSASYKPSHLESYGTYDIASMFRVSDPSRDTLQTTASGMRCHL